MRVPKLVRRSWCETLVESEIHMLELRAFGQFVLTAMAKIVDCDLPYLWLRRNGSPRLLLPVALL